MIKMMIGSICVVISLSFASAERVTVEKQLNKIFSDHVVMELSLPMWTVCLEHCSRIPACKSIYFIKSKKVCQIHDEAPDGTKTCLQDSTGDIFVAASSVSEELAGSCESNGCTRNQICVENSADYTCKPYQEKEKLPTDCGDIDKTNQEKEKLPEKLPTDCGDIDKTHSSGIYMVYPEGSKEGLEVYCNMETDNGCWTVFQRRIDGTIDFYRGWSQYENGFGDLKTEFWLGNFNIHSITSQGQYELRIDLGDFENNTAYANYTTFSVGDKDSNYKLTVGGYSGDASDSLNYHNGSLFSTSDKDNDGSTSNLAEVYKGGWWFRGWSYSNLNGAYLKGKHNSYGKGVHWRHWKGNYYSLKYTAMMTRKVK